MNYFNINTSNVEDLKKIREIAIQAFNNTEDEKTKEKIQEDLWDLNDAIGDFVQEETD